VATGKTCEEVEKNMYEAIEMHVKGLLANNQPVPEPTAFSEYMVVK